ncbi:hypothetical protein MPS_2811 [Mycobacterium pseudoshottsii JCM 15466]|nr:hypothetical protein MMSP_1601 [Mycobacterium sp. 012931]GAQ35719.1 hypothetical protein MPS_2811 [Mycobacterium pseudoshottsii JCM 15466]
MGATRPLPSGANVAVVIRRGMTAARCIDAGCLAALANRWLLIPIKL